MISQDKINEILEATDIVDLVSNYVTLTKKGSNYMGLCPFHDEKTPSFSVSPTKKIAVCMGCHKGGDAINFLKQVENISFNEAASILAKKYNIELDVTINEKKPNENANLYKIMDFATKYYQYYLNNSKSGINALNYLHSRGLNDETINIFNIGLSPNAYDVLYKTAIEDGYIEMDLLKTELIKSSNNGYYDLFQNRVMFPIKDDFGNYLGFSGRIYYDDKNQPKYVNSPESVIFKKGEVLYNLFNAKSDIRRTNRIILMEGFLDVISSYNAGLKEVVCSMGTALTINQANLIKKYTDNAIICYDGDNAGFEATNKAIKVLTEARLNVSIVALKENLDPDEYVKKYGKDDFLKLFENPINIKEYQYLHIIRGKDLSNINHVEYIKNSAFKFIYETKSETLKEKYFKRLSNDLNVSLDSIVNDYNSYYKFSPIENSVEKKSKEKKFNRGLKQKYSNADKTIIAYMLKSRKAFDYIYEKYKMSPTQEASAIDLITKIHEYYYDTLEYSDIVDISYFRKLLGNDENQITSLDSQLELLDNVQKMFPFGMDMNEKAFKKALDDCLITLSEKSIDYEENDLKRKANDATTITEKLLHETKRKELKKSIINETQIKRK